MDALNAEIEELEKQKEELEKKSAKKNASAGQKCRRASLCAWNAGERLRIDE